MDSDFDTKANSIINHTWLVINQQFYQIVELEFYLYSDQHPDLYCHSHPDQLTTNKWYFHRAGKSSNSKYKGGTYKGLDITFGNSNQYGGILIRSIQSVDNQEVIEGPCKVVNRILELCQTNSIQELVKTISLDINQIDNLFLTCRLNHSILVENRIQELTILILPVVDPLKISKGPRVGLSLKGDFSNKEPYLFRSYRYGIFDLLKKEKWGFILADPTRRAGSRYEQNFILGARASEIKHQSDLKSIADKCFCYGYLTVKYKL